MSLFSKSRDEARRRWGTETHKGRDWKNVRWGFIQGGVWGQAEERQVIAARLHKMADALEVGSREGSVVESVTAKALRDLANDLTGGHEPFTNSEVLQAIETSLGAEAPAPNVKAKHS